MFRRLFVDHPHAVGESYIQHQRVALSFALSLICAGLACLIHALVPGLFVRTGSRMVEDLHHRIVSSGRTGPTDEQAASGLQAHTIQRSTV